MKGLEKELECQAGKILQLEEIETVLERAEKDKKRNIEYLTLCLDEIQEKGIAGGNAYEANQEIIQCLDDENEALRAGDTSGMAKRIEALPELLESVTA